MSKFRIFEKMETESSPQLTKPKIQMNEPTNGTARINYYQKCLTKSYNGTVEELELIKKNYYYS